MPSAAEKPSPGGDDETPVYISSVPSRSPQIVPPPDSPIASIHPSASVASFEAYPPDSTTAIKSPQASFFGSMTEDMFGSEKEAAHDPFPAAEDESLDGSRPPLGPAIEFTSARRASSSVGGTTTGNDSRAPSPHVPPPVLEYAAVSGSSDETDHEHNSFGASSKSEGVLLAAAHSARRKRPRLKRPRLVDHHEGDTSRRPDWDRTEASKVLGEGSGTPRRDQGSIADSPPEPSVSSTTLPGPGIRRASTVGGASHPSIRYGRETGFPPTPPPPPPPSVSPPATARPADAPEPVPWRISPLDALRSNPPGPSRMPRRAATMPAKGRRTTFGPPPIEVGTGTRFERQSVISTPHPASGRFERKFSFLDEEAVGTAGPVSLRIVVYGGGGIVPRIGKVAVPKEEIPAGREETRPGKLAKASVAKRYDDEELFRSIRTAYEELRGYGRLFFSARTTSGVRLVSYTHPSQLVPSGGERAPRTNFFHIRGVEFPEELFLKLFHNPGEGRGRYIWAKWVRDLRKNKEREGVDGHEQIALEFIPGWSVARIASIGLGIIVCSLLAMLLWITLGVGGQSRDPMGSFGPGQESGGLEGAGARVGPGAAIGILALLLGWTGLCGWLAMSWLLT
jgi:hypothetical protein